MSSIKQVANDCQLMTKSYTGSSVTAYTEQSFCTTYTVWQSVRLQVQLSIVPVAKNK